MGRESYKRSYHWNAANQLVQTIDHVKNKGISYTYDALNQLVSATIGSAETELKNPDAVGNLYETPDRKDRKYDKGGRLSEDKTYHYHYDDLGNLIFKEYRQSEFTQIISSKTLEKEYKIKSKSTATGWLYIWQGNGMLREVLRPNGKRVQFEYDGFGRRITKIYNNRITRYLWDGNILLQEWNYDLNERPVLQVGELGELFYNKSEPNENLVTWIYEEGKYCPIAKLNFTNSFSIVNDYIGRPKCVYDDLGNLVWSAEFDLYGNIKILIGDEFFVPFRQLGQFEDDELGGLYYNRFRYYDSNSGLYISKDPIGLLGGLRLYAYIKDVNWWVDIFGLTGTYIFVFDTGNYYIGKGPIDRAEVSQNVRTNEVKIKNNGVSPTITQGAHIDWGDDKTGFLVEQELINRKGAVADPMGLNRINQPGAKPLEEMKINDPNAYADIVKKADEVEAKLAKSTGKIKCK